MQAEAHLESETPKQAHEEELETELAKEDTETLEQFEAEED